MISFKDISIRNKLILIQGVTALIAVLTCCTIFVINDVNIYKQASYANKKTIAEVIGQNAVSTIYFQDKEAATKILSNLSNNESILNAAILDKTGNIFATYSTKNEQGYVFSLKENLYTGETFSGNKFLVRHPIVQNNELLGTVLLRSELTDVTKIIFTYLKAAGLVLLVSLVIALVISYFLQQTISNRLFSLVSKTKEVSQTGDYSIRAEVNSKDEIAVLASGFNGMMIQIEMMEKTLRDANLSLETRVKERTYELETANKEMESFSYSVSHDMRAPLRTINGYSKIIDKKYGHLLDEDGKEVLQTINDEATRMGKLIDDLLAFSRLGRQEVQKTQVDMNALAAQAVKEVLRSEEHASKASISIDNLPPASADANLLQQVFINLLSNAVKYSSRNAEPIVHVGSQKEKGKVVYFVKDNGAGFDMQYYNKLFGVFQRLHSQDEFKGTGIGLAIVQKIILRHGGRIWAESKPGKGTVFYFTLSPAKG
jgi:signal transduction histidine kinase